MLEEALLPNLHLEDADGDILALHPSIALSNLPLAQGLERPEVSKPYGLILPLATTSPTTSIG
jgi:hypothetical protein